MRDAIRHRGPDDSGLWDDPLCSLGHARLSIIDLSPAGRQPMANEDGTVQLVYNGELYGFGPLRTRLEAAGHRFRSRTDTEVVVHLYEEYGEDFVRHLHGMFALAIWDVRKRKLVLARDRFGQKPLFYAPVGDGLAFGSEIKALLQHPDISRDVDLRAVDTFLAVHFVPSPHSFYEAIRRLPPASLLVWEPGRTPQVRRYWHLTPAPERRLTFGEAAEEVEHHFARAVREQLVADVPVGLFLSGGIDSSLVLAEASRHSGSIDTYSIGFEERAFSELAHARAVAETFQSRHHQIIMRASDVRDPERLIDLFDEPFADIAALPQVALSRTARPAVKVVLTGDGGDELFGGYQHHVLGYWLDRTRAASRARAAAARLALRLMPSARLLGRRGRSLVRGLEAVSHISPLKAAAALRATLSFTQRAALYDPEFLDSLGDADPYPCLEADHLGVPADERADALFHVSGDLMLADQFLHKTDIASMAVGLECRSPFLDAELAGLVASLPTDFKVCGLKGKHILRRVLARRVDPAIWDRPKMGLSVPVAEWIKEELAPQVRDTILAPGARIASYVRQAEVIRLYREHCNGTANRRRILWALLLLELWLRRRNTQHTATISCASA